jgi:hypothetical protein
MTWRDMALSWLSTDTFTFKGILQWRRHQFLQWVILNAKVHIKKTPWSESASEL